MIFDEEAYIMGFEAGKGKGVIVLEGGITCTDENSDGNIVITEEN